MALLDLFKRKKEKQDSKDKVLDIKKEDKYISEISEISNWEQKLPRGTGYKSSWLVIEGSNQKEIADKLLLAGYDKVDYDCGLEYEKKASFNEKKVIVSPNFHDRNYVIGIRIGELFYDLESITDKCRDFSKVYMYMTHRVSEAHGFALIEFGKIIRLYKYDEEEIVVIGDPLPEEVDLGINLPKDIDEMWEHWEDEAVTKMDEQVIIEIALKQAGAGEGEFVYGDVYYGTMD